MDIGISLPVAISGVDGRTLVEWARRSEEYPFSALSVLDRVVYPNYEPLITLAAAASVTERVRLVTSVLLAPLRMNIALLAKQVATLDSISGGRVVLGMGVGNRQDDFDLSGADFHHRGRFFDRQIEQMRRIWSGEGGIGPAPVQAGGPPLLIGGRSDAAIGRAARLGNGWVMGGGGPAEFKRLGTAVKATWAEAGRGGSPRLQSTARFALGPNGREQAEAGQRAYYNFRGAPAGDPTGGALLSAGAIKQAVAAYDEAGCDELIFSGAIADIEQVDQLARILF